LVHVLSSFLSASPLSVSLTCIFVTYPTEEVVLQPVDVEMQSLPISTPSSLAHETPSTAIGNDSGLSTIQEIKKRLEEPRR
jgi:hypothetical protein